MKPCLWIGTSLGVTSLLAVAGSIAGPGLADNRASFALDSIPNGPQPIELASLPPSTDHLWVKVRSDVPLEELANKLSVNETQLARLNEVNEDHRFLPGDWLVLPTSSSRKAKNLASLDTSALRRTPPIQAPPPLEQSAVVRFGENLRQIAQRTGVTITDLLRLNPGLEAARLVVGSEIRVAQSASGRTATVLGIAPSTSGGLSWPEMPSFGDPQNPDSGPNNAIPFNATGWIWPTQGIFSSGYGWRWGRMHKGIDVANNIGTPIVASKAGRVLRAGWNDGGYGYLVEIQHEDGSSTLYGHNSRILVRVGDVVEQGALISLMGSTGNSTGPHLHFEIRPPGRGAVNPLPFLPLRA
jgi:murein DD-endopeptidase MepM/ murein hydrolase activator NlpD